jgi:hypothetical protein
VMMSNGKERRFSTLLKRAFDRSLGELKFYESVAGILLVDL